MFVTQIPAKERERISWKEKKKIGGKMETRKFKRLRWKSSTTGRAANPETDASRFNRQRRETRTLLHRNLTWPRVRMLRVSSDGLIKPGAERVRECSLDIQRLLHSCSLRLSPRATTLVEYERGETGRTASKYL